MKSLSLCTILAKNYCFVPAINWTIEGEHKYNLLLNFKKLTNQMISLIIILKYYCTLQKY